MVVRTRLTQDLISTLQEFWRPKIVMLGSASIALLAGHDAASNQLGLPKIGELVGNSGTLFFPWWGWLLILQTLFVYELFEFVRRSCER